MPKAITRAFIWYQAPKADPPLNIVQRGVELVEIVTGGRGWVEIDGELVEVTRGALLWHVEGDQPITRSDWENPYRCLAFAFETERFRGRRRAPCIAWWHDAEEVERFGQEVIRAHLDEGADREALLHYAYGRLLFQSRQWERAARNRAAFPPKLCKALELLEETSGLNIRQIARRVDWSLPHLHEMFIKHLEITPYQYLLRRRMRTAREMLSMTDAPLKQIAAACGFAGASSFCSTFKAHVGITPMGYRHRESRV